MDCDPNTGRGATVPQGPKWPSVEGSPPLNASLAGKTAGLGKRSVRTHVTGAVGDETVQARLSPGPCPLLLPLVAWPR